MDYCGVEFTTAGSAEGSSWKWQLLILDQDKMKTSGDAASRSAAINQAHDAIGEGLRSNASSTMSCSCLNWSAVSFISFRGLGASRQPKRSRR